MTRIVRSCAITAVVVGVALALAAGALAAKSGIWDGSTSQTFGTGALPISLEVSHNKVTVIFYGANYTGNSTRCARADGPDAQRLDPNTGFKGFKIKHNKFGGRFNAGSGDQISLGGQFKGNTVSGSFSESFSVEGIHCHTGRVTFSAKPGDELI